MFAIFIKKKNYRRESEIENQISFIVFVCSFCAVRWCIDWHERNRIKYDKKRSKKEFEEEEKKRWLVKQSVPNTRERASVEYT